MPHTPIILFGATGRMGRAIRAALGEFPDAGLVACVARSTDDVSCPPGCTWMTIQDLTSSTALPKEAVVIDVSLAAGTYRGGLLSPRHENGVRQFQDLIRAAEAHQP